MKVGLCMLNWDADFVVDLPPDWSDMRAVMYGLNRAIKEDLLVMVTRNGKDWLVNPRHIQTVYPVGREEERS